MVVLKHDSLKCTKSELRGMAWVNLWALNQVNSAESGENAECLVGKDGAKKFTLEGNVKNS